MPTYNEVKQLLNQGIFPCLIINNNEVDYIMGYDDNNFGCWTKNDIFFQADGENSGLYQTTSDWGNETR